MTTSDMARSDRPGIWALIRRPLLALAGLTLLLGMTTFLAFVPMGPWNLVVSLAIAAAKVGIIVIVFMELTEGSGVQILAAGVGVFWLAFLFLLAFADYLSR